MKVFFASSHDLSAPIAESLIEKNLVSGFITNSNKPVGRKKELTPNSFANWAKETKIPVFQPNSSNELDELLLDHSVDLVVTCAYGSLIRKKSLEIPKYGWLNIHFSVLPKYRGAAPAQRAILNGETTTGYTIFKLDEGIDTGPVLFSEGIQIVEDIGVTQLLVQLADLAAKALPNLLAEPHTWKFRVQSGAPSSAPKILKEEKRINWSNNARYICNLERGLEINGGVHAFFRGEKISLSEFSIANLTLKPGEILSQNSELYLGTADAAIKIGKVQPAGKNWMLAPMWLNGARIKPGEAFE